jgi:CRISPR-associated RAMP protein (TIGR02581 family)
MRIRRRMMLKQLLNECVIDLHIMIDGPVLIRSGVETISGPDMSFVKIWRKGQEEVYLPGSSLKGVLRSHAERIARTLKDGAACDPFDQEGHDRFCGHCFKKLDEDGKFPDYEKEPDQLNQRVYEYSCPICRLFGSTWFASRLAVADAYVTGEPPPLQPRDGVGIDRFTGGAVGGVKFDFEVITEGCFVTALHLRNFELWQLGLVGFLLQDLKDGLIRIGSSKSRGMGKVRGEIQTVEVHYLGPQAPKPTAEGRLQILGVADMYEHAEAYGMKTSEPVYTTLPKEGIPTDNKRHLRTIYEFSDGAFPWKDLVDVWVAFAEGYEMPEDMAKIRRGEGGMK